MAVNNIGRTFSGRYRIVERIGIGGMAEVYRAQDTVLGRIVAVKVMLPQYAADADFTRRFRQEAASAANLQSPYIVNVYDWGQDEGTYYIVMEYVRGSDLKTAIKERGAINQRKVAEIASQSCQALSVAHHMDIVHRDVKPQNIMVQPDGNVKVMDFGIARAKNSVKSQTSSVLGTAHYISPEQAQGKELTAASDIYSLGVCMYEAITGQLPFDGPDAVSVAMKQVSEQPKPLHEVYPGVDPVLEAIVLRAMAKDPRQRFATALDMRQVLNDYLSGRARGEGAARAILAGATGAAVAAAMASGAADDPTHAMGAASNQQTKMMNNVPPATSSANQTRVMNPVDDGNQAAWDAAVVQTPAGPTNYRESDTVKKGGRGKKVAIVLLILALLAAGGVAAYLYLTHEPDTVPDVAGKTLEQAREDLTEAGYVLGNTTEVFSDTVDSGKVVSTDPAAGAEAQRGSRVNLTVSKGKEQVKVPDVVGMAGTQGKQALENMGLKTTEGASEHSDTVEKDAIIRTSPAAGTTVDKGTSVTYILSLGPDTREVPDVRGQSSDTATANLENAGLKVSVREEYSDTVAEGLVIYQTPEPGTEVNKDSTVEIAVSLGERLVSVPNVVGMTVSDARSILSNAGFAVSESDDYTGSAVVTSQSVSGEAREGSSVNLTAQEPEPPKSTSSSSDSSKSSSSSAESKSSEEKSSSSASSSASAAAGAGAKAALDAEAVAETPLADDGVESMLEALDEPLEESLEEEDSIE